MGYWSYAGLPQHGYGERSNLGFTVQGNNTTREHIASSHRFSDRLIKFSEVTKATSIDTPWTRPIKCLDRLRASHHTKKINKEEVYILTLGLRKRFGNRQYGVRFIGQNDYSGN